MCNDEFESFARVLSYSVWMLTALSVLSNSLSARSSFSHSYSFSSSSSSSSFFAAAGAAHLSGGSAGVSSDDLASSLLLAAYSPKYE